MSIVLLLILGLALASGTVAAASASTSAPTGPDLSLAPDIVKSSAWRKYDARFQDYGLRYAVDWTWTKAICMNESMLGTISAAYVPRTDDGSGLMQIKYDTASDMAGYDISPDDLVGNDDLSIDLATRYLAHLQSTFNGDMRKTVMSYNQGEGNTKAGHEYAADYFMKFLSNLGTVQTYS